YFIIFLLFIAGIDYAFNKYRYEKSLMMTPKEMKEELKETEGDPFVKSRIRQMGRKILRKRMLENVKTSDVVITNPTLISVALKYEEGKMNAPKVVAKGMGKLAEEIVKIAQINGVIIVENKTLARLLYRICEVDEEIPVKLYKAVAEVLAYVYILKNRL
ncbi:MAG: EscU/YscU/HrcU family type III secretion system export apparatus switch protein, partial [bacterium]|nr:EscU/YscU/HrcU family type III secretion system export apparatus switch protein [bacterium]MDW8164654.1 EscU/YscU/HrcU family type III secretion system export apparatus switch protein [Candidatus Omnitrophota bacterium]